LIGEFVFAGTLRYSYSVGEVSGGTNRVGGLVGVASWSTSIHDCYSRTNVSCPSGSVGGLIGKSDVILTNCYSTGFVDGDTDSGGLVGINTGTITNSYYDSTISEQSDTGKGEPRTTAEMVYPYVDFPENVYTDWFFCENGTEQINDGYPVFIWQLPIWKHDRDHKINDGYPYFAWQKPRYRFVRRLLIPMPGGTIIPI